MKNPMKILMKNTMKIPMKIPMMIHTKGLMTTITGFLRVSYKSSSLRSHFYSD